MLTVKAIAAFHERPVIAIRQNCLNNRQYFKEGVDFFNISASEAKEAGFLHPSQVESKFSTQALFTYGGPGVMLFTKSGYLMLVKTMTDPKAWQVQRTLVDCYFQLEEIKTVLEETGGVDVAPEAVDDDNTL